MTGVGSAPGSVRRSRFGLSAAVLAAVTVISGCAGGVAADPGSDEAPVATASVDLPKSYRFAPPAIEVTAGATVTWTNHDDFTHNVTFEGDATLVMKPGEAVSRPFPTTGTFAYLCTLHPRDMQGSVLVTPAG